MKKWIAILAGLLLVQLALAVAFNSSKDEYQAFSANEPLLAIDSKAVDGLRLDDGKQHVVLKRSGGKWILPEAGEFPADGKAVVRLLGKLTGLKKGWPVATTASAARRFKVAPDDYERRIQLLQDDKVLATLYVGTSPGLRKVHARIDGDDAIHAVALNSWEIAGKTDDWIDKDVLKLDAAAMTRVELPAVTLIRQDKDMVVEGAADKTNTSETASVIERLAGLQVRGLVDADTAKKYRKNKPTFVIELTHKDGVALHYRFDQAGDEGWYLLRRSDMARDFRVDNYTAEYLRDMSRDKLVNDKGGAGQDKPAT